MSLLFLLVAAFAASSVMAARQKPQKPWQRNLQQFENLKNYDTNDKYKITSKDNVEHLYTLHEFKDHHGKVQVAFSSVGEGTFSGPITSRGGESQLQQLDVSGNLTVGKKLQVLSEANAHSINVSHRLVATEKATVDFHGKVNFLAQTKNTKEVHFVNGWKSSANVHVDGIIDATAVNIKENLAVGDVKSSGSIEAKNGIQASQVIASDSIKGRTICAESALDVKGITSSQSLVVTSSIYAKDLQANGTASVNALAMKSAPLKTI